MNDLAYRRPRPDELAACGLVWHSAVDDYMRRLNRPLPPPVLDSLVTLLEHLLATDPDGFLVAVRPGRLRHRDEVVAFGIGVRRDDVWFLSQLYVLPELQGQGVGGAILRKILPDGAAPSAGRRDESLDDGPVLATTTDTAQPISNALYSAYGIVPRLPLFNLVGRPVDHPRREPARGLPDGIEAVPFAQLAGRPTGAAPAGPGHARLAAAIDAIDRDVLGFAHPQDHRYLRLTERVGYLYRTVEGHVLGYGYSSLVGRFGPVAVLDGALMGPVVEHLLAAVEPRGATSAWVPGASGEAMLAMLRSGLRIEGFPALLCWTRPFASFDRYLPGGPALI